MEWQRGITEAAQRFAGYRSTDLYPPSGAEVNEWVAVMQFETGEEMQRWLDSPERCGYALHGLPQSRCERCTILQFACPDCGHHQPINTLRPAAMRLMGRVRAFFLGLWVFFKLNFFGWLLFAWFGMGVEWSFNQRSIPIYLDPSGAQIVSPPVGGRRAGGPTTWSRDRWTLKRRWRS